jgi:hypothetical protein
MAYLGNAPARSFISFERQVFTIVNSQTAYTLDHSVNNENDIRLVINNIVQEPGSGKAYTASGTTLTLSAALVNGTDEMYCVFLGRATATNAPGAGSVGTSQLASDAITAAKLNDDIISGQTALGATPADTDEFLVSDAGTLKRVDYSYLKSANTPAFEAYLSSNQDTSNTTYDKIDCDTEVFDTDGCYDHSTNYRFTPTTAGKYFVYAGAVLESSIQSRLTYTQILIYKNGSAYKNGTFDMNDSYQENKTVITLNAAIDMNGSSDYLEFYVYMEANSATPRLQGGSSSKPTYFGAYKLIGV